MPYAAVDGTELYYERRGTGEPLLLIQGMSGTHLAWGEPFLTALGDDLDVVTYNHRGVGSSGPQPDAVTIVGLADDAAGVLDALGWETAYVVGHSWGGHLALHVAEAMPDRLRGVLCVDPLGAIGDGRWPEFDEEIFRRTPESVRERARELDELAMTGAADDATAQEAMRLAWPAYFADREAAPPMPELQMASERTGQMVPSINAELPKLEAGLPQIQVPVGFVHGSRSPMPLEASTDAAERIPGAWMDVVEGAGHFIWVEAPGAVRASLRRLNAA